MHFEGEFRVPGKAEDVIRRFADVPRMARCMPGAVLEPQTDDGAWPGAMVVAFGPKKINFKGRVTCEFDLAAKTGTLHGRGSADMRAARIGVKVAFALRDDPATFARTGGIAVANVIMQDFARRAAEEFASDAPSAQTQQISPAALSAHSVLWQVVRTKLMQFVRWLGIARA
jgi:carbon monoxide dehydrogenase subunit G